MVIVIKEAAERALRDAGIDPEPSFKRDPNRRRILESLCARHKIPAIYKPRETDECL